jgi:hypothetical protein
MEFDQWRPYVTMMHARAVATPLVQLEQWEAAVNVLDAGIRGIEDFLKDYNQLEKAGQVGELNFLQRWKREILEKTQPALEDGGKISPASETPLDPIDQLREDLKRAVAEERYEDASRLRDELRRIEEPPPPSTGTWTG